ncbi:anti-sigma factor domain-containing protein [Deinococcus navajonensis]|uniref:Regulator of SigK n=1 Tax=Deinococcus navajonensis TaxID=309884 RepID=A0ABV8XU49_9DEIO
MTTEHDQLIAYALGQLAPDEAAHVEAAIEANPALQTELQRHLDALEHLLDDLDLQAVQVPEGAEERLLARVRAEAAGAEGQPWAPIQALPRLEIPPSEEGLHAAPRVPAAGPVTGSPSSRGRSRRGSWWLPATLALAAAVTLFVVLRPTTDPLERYARMPGAVRQDVTTAQGAVGTLVRLSDGRVYVQLSRAPAEGRTYQLWQVGAGQPASLGVFGAEGLLTNNLPPEVTLAVSVEPQGGSPQPTTQPLFAQKL